MRVLLTLAKSSEIKAGVEIFSDHILKAIPGVEIVDYNSIRKFFPEPHSFNKNPVYVKRLNQWFMNNISRYNPEFVITNGMDGWNLKDINCPVINIQHGTFPAFADLALRKNTLNYWRTRYVYSHYEKMSARTATKVVSNSTSTMNNVKKYYDVDSEVINNAIDTEKIKPIKKDKAREELQIPEKETAIFVGRPDYTKGFDIVESLARKYNDITFLYVFPFGYESKRKNVITFSNIPHDKLSTLYSAADICINPSRFEGFGYVPLEALACNVPVIGNSTGVLSSNNIEGFIPVPNNALNYYIEKLPDVIGTQTNSRSEIIKNFSFEVFAQRYREIVRSLGQV